MKVLSGKPSVGATIHLVLSLGLGISLSTWQYLIDLVWSHMGMSAPVTVIDWPNQCWLTFPRFCPSQQGPGQTQPSHCTKLCSHCLGLPSSVPNPFCMLWPPLLPTQPCSWAHLVKSNRTQLHSEGVERIDYWRAWGIGEGGKTDTYLGHYNRVKQQVSGGSITWPRDRTAG